MLTYFRIINFRSIVDLTLDFTFGEKRAPNGYQHTDRLPFIEDGTARAVPCLALFGANAAGKSNVILAMRIFIALVQGKKRDVRKWHDPNRIVTCGDVTRFEATFAKDSHRYTYTIAYNGVGIVEECLVADGKMLFSVGENALDFSGIDDNKTYDVEKLEHVHKVECRTDDGVIIYPLFPIIGIDYGGLNASLSTAFKAIARGINVFSEDFGPVLLPLAIDMMCEKRKCSKEKALQDVVEIVRKLDVDIVSLDIVEYTKEQFDKPMFRYDLVRHEHESGKDIGIEIHSEHRNDKGEQIVFRFLEQESEGTKRLAVVVAVILAALASGGIVFFDEFDRALHPLLVCELLSLFQKRSYNPHGAQLCFATHCTDILDDAVLRMSEVGIVKKNIRTGTFVRRLTDFKNEGYEVRNVTNFRKRYLDGFYAGIPYPAL